MLQLVLTLGFCVFSTTSAPCNDFKDKSGCAECGSGWHSMNRLCVKNTPSGCSGSCCNAASQDVFDLEFYKLTDTSLSSICSFSTLGSAQFQENSRTSPIVTGQRGFYFDHLSQLSASQNYIPGIKHTVVFWVKPFLGGNLLTMKDNSKTHYQISYSPSNWNFHSRYAEVSINQKFLGLILKEEVYVSAYKAKHIQATQTSGIWNRVKFSIDEQYTHSRSCNCFLGICSTCYDYFYRCKFRAFLGSSQETYSQLDNCWAISDIDTSSVVWNIGKGESEDSFTGFLYRLLFRNSNIDESMAGWEPSELPLNYDFSGFPPYGNFQSGANSGTYFPFGSGETDDVLPLKDRGVFYDSNKFLENHQVELHHSFSLSMWVRATSSGQIMTKGVYLTVEETKITLRMEDFSGNAQQKEVTLSGGLNTWYHVAYSYESQSPGSTLKSYLDNTSENSLSEPELVFREPGTDSLVLGKGASGFIYMLKIWQEAVSDYSSDYCVGGTKSTCFSSCGVEQYQDATGSCLGCNDCPEGCVRGTDCNLCFDSSCGNCFSFDDGACISCDASPCNCPAGYFEEDVTCKLCHPGCTECSSSRYNGCSVCISGQYLLYSMMCVPTCPTGYDNPSTTCDLPIELVVDLQFYDEIKGDLGGFSYGSDSNFYPDLDPNDPWPAKDRGYYFHPNAYVQKSLHIAPKFTILGWFKLTSDSGTLLYKGDNSVNDKLHISFSGGSISVQLTTLDELVSGTGSNNLKDSWKYFAVSSDILATGETKLTATIDSSTEFSAQSSVATFFNDDSIYQLILGSSTSSFEGFFWSLKVFQAPDKAGTDHPFSGSRSDCPISEFPDSEGCSSCVDCPEGCVRAEDCNLCADRLCEQCDTFGAGCIQCKPNASYNLGVCECNLGYFEFMGQCVECIQNCDSCDSSDSYGCAQCSSGYFVIQGVCKTFCPSGYSSNSGVCDLDDDFVFHLQPHGIQDIVTDTQSSIPVHTGEDSSFHPSPSLYDPIPAKDRGYYFDGSAYMQLAPSPSLALAPEFTVAIWVRPTADSGTLLAKQRDSPEVSSLIQVSLNSTQPQVDLNLTSSSHTATESVEQGWNFLAVGIHLNSTVPEFQVIAYLNSTQVISGSLGGEWLDDLQSSYLFSIGAQHSDQTTFSNFYTGFLWEVRIYNSHKDPTTLLESSNCDSCSFCPVYNQNQCLPNCLITDFWDGTECAECDSECTSGCSRQHTCNLCINSLCVDCGSFETGDCSECKPNASGNPCLCDEGYGLDRLNLSCVECFSSMGRQVIDNKCYCMDGYFNKDSTGIDCQRCTANCSFVDLDTVNCEVEHSFRNLSGDCVCEERYFLHDSKCIKCYPTCKTCSGSDHNDCLSCDGAYLYPDGTCGPCAVGTYLEDTQCLDCVELCVTCENQVECLECTENSSMNQDKTCSCNKGFTSLNNTCECLEGFIRDQVCTNFYSNLTCDNDNLLTLTFSEQLVSSLTKKSFAIQLQNKSIEYTYSFQEVNNTKYEIDLDFETYVAEGEIVTLEFLSGVNSTSGFSLGVNSSNLHTKLSFFNPADEVTKEAKDTAKTTTAIATGVSGGAAILSFNPSGIWQILNTIQLLTYISITSNPLTPSLRGHFTGTSLLERIPKAINYGSDNSSSDTNHYSREHRFDSNLFVMNAGGSITILLVLLGSWLLVWVISKIRVGCIRTASNFILTKFKFSILIRYWIQTYLDLAIPCLIQFTSLPKLHIEVILNFLVGCLFFTLIAVTPLGLVLFFNSKKDQVTSNSTDSDFYKTWGSLFYEFKCDTTMKTLTYSVFTFKRLLFAASLILLSELPVVQGISNLLLMLGFLVFLVVVRPYKDKVVQAISIAVETGVTLIFGLILYYLRQDIGDWGSVLETAILWISNGLMVIQSLGAVLGLILKLYSWCRNKTSVENLSTQYETTIANQDNPEFTPEACDSEKPDFNN